MDIKKINLLFEFYKSSLQITITIILISVFLTPDTLLINLILICPIIIFIYKEFYKKNEYIFYYNNNIHKAELYLFYVIFNFLLYLPLKIMYYELFT